MPPDSGSRTRPRPGRRSRHKPAEFRVRSDPAGARRPLATGLTRRRGPRRVQTSDARLRNLERAWLQRFAESYGTTTSSSHSPPPGPATRAERLGRPLIGFALQPGPGASGRRASRRRSKSTRRSKARTESRSAGSPSPAGAASPGGSTLPASTSGEGGPDGERCRRVRCAHRRRWWCAGRPLRASPLRWSHPSPRVERGRG
jgi:hypothetical protein